MRRNSACACLLVLLGAASCAPAKPMRPNLTFGQATTVGRGTILSMRAVPAANDGNRWHAGLLAGASATAMPDDKAGSPVTEFIVRQDDGATISVVQSNEFGFRPGDRVSILRDERTHLDRAG